MLKGRPLWDNFLLRLLCKIPESAGIIDGVRNALPCPHRIVKIHTKGPFPYGSEIYWNGAKRRTFYFWAYTQTSFVGPHAVAVHLRMSAFG